MAIIRPNGKITNIALFKKETTEGTYVAPTQSIHAISEGLKYTPKTVEDASNIGQVFTTDLVKVGYDVAGAVETNLHPYFVGNSFFYTLGKDTAVSNPWSAICLLWYTGAETYIRISKATDTLTVEKSTDGAIWVADTAFNTTGSIDLTAGGFDTIAELSAAIEAYTGYEADYRGLGTELSTTIPDFSATIIVNNGDNRGAFFLKAVTASSVAKEHYIYASNSAGDDLPSFSGIVDRGYGSGKSFGFAGCKMSSMSLKATSKDFLKATLNITAKNQANDKTYGATAVPETTAFVTNNGQVWVDRMKTNELKDLTIEINNNLTKDEAIGNDTHNALIRQGAVINVSGTFNLTVTTTTDRVTAEFQDKMQSNTPIELIAYFENVGYADEANDIKYAILIRIPKIQLSDATPVVTGADRLTLPITGQAVRDDYWKHIEVYVIDTTTTQY